MKDSAMVFEQAEETARIYHERMEEERKQQESTARDIVLGLGDSLEELGVDDGEAAGDDEAESKDPLEDVSDNLDSLLS